MAVAYESKESNRALLTRAEYEALVDRGVLEDARVELLYGRIVSMSPIGDAHAYSVSELMKLLVRRLDDAQARVRVQSSFAASNDSEPEPDVAVVAPGNYLDGRPRTAHLIIEVAQSSLAHDRAKARLYAAAGVTEYWIVNLPKELIEVHLEPHGEGYARVTRHGRGEELHLAAFPHIAIRVDDVLPPKS
jgi:Uma2 family endonuclease